MSRIVQYLAIAFVAIPPASGPNTTTSGWQPLPEPLAFAKPVKAAEQQYAAHLNFSVPTAITPHGWEGLQYEYQFAKPFPAPQQQFQALAPIHVPFAVDIQGYPRDWDYRFAKPVPAAVQQFAAFQPQGRITSTFPDGFRGLQWDYRFAKPFPVEQQQFLTHLAHLIPTPAPKQAFWPQPPDVFAKPFPVSAQQYTGYFKFPDPITPQGWYPQPPDIFKRPVPVSEQPFTTWPEPEPFPPPNGWWGYQFEYQFAKPFPVTEQVFAVWDLVGAVPPNLPPGAGKRYKYPTDYLPEPAYDVKPAKKFRPVWDKPRDGEIEQHPQAPKPVPLPPPELFARMQPGSTPVPQNLPNFDQFVPPDPMGLKHRIEDAQDASDATAVLKALGLLGDEG